MSAFHTASTCSDPTNIAADGSTTHRILVSVSDELLAAVEGWRQVHGVDQSEAVGTLVRLGLLSEIAKIYRFVSEKRPPGSTQGAAKKPGGQVGEAGRRPSLAR